MDEGLINPVVQVGDYRVFRIMSDEYILGRGSFGTVFKAFGTNNELVAAKQISLAQLDDRYSNVRENEHFPRTKDLRHSNIISILHSQTIENYLYIILEYCKFTLSQYLNDEYDGIQCLRALIVQMSAAVTYLHSKKIAHRDLKAANVMIIIKDTSDGNAPTENGPLPWVKITDFSLSKDWGSRGTMTSVQGTLSWLPPECLNRGNRKTADLMKDEDFAKLDRADVYALGLLSAYVCMVMNGRRIIDTSICAEHPSASNLVRSVFTPYWRPELEELKDVISDMLAPEPHLRPTAALAENRILDHQSFADVNMELVSLDFVGEHSEVVVSDVSREQDAVPCLCENPDLIVVGGHLEEPDLNDKCWRVKENENSWTEIKEATLRAITLRHCICPIPGGFALIGGQSNPPSRPCTIFQVFRFTTKLWSPNYPMPTGRSACAAVFLNGEVYVLGGRGIATNRNQEWEPLNACESFNLHHLRWTHRPVMKDAMSWPLATSIGDDLYVLFHNHQFNGERRTLQRYLTADQQCQQWEHLAQLPEAFGSTDGASVIAISDRRMMVIGGRGSLCATYSVSTDQWSHFQPPSSCRLGAALVIIRCRPDEGQRDEEVLVLGGKQKDVDEKRTDDAEVYNITRNEWRCNPLKLPKKLSRLKAFYQMCPHPDH